MNYFVMREGEQLGPYSLADLQRQLTEGGIQPTDMARSEGLDQWVPVQQVVGNIPVQQPAPPPPVNYGQVSVYSQESGGAPAMGSAGPVPPGLHWVLVLVLGIVTLYIFGYVWMFVEAAYAHRLRTKSTPLLFYGIGIPAIFVARVLPAIGGTKAFASELLVAAAVLVIAGHFSIKNALEDYYNRVEPIHLKLSGVMTFFFNVLYFQYHFSKIRRWKLTGERTWNSEVPSILDATPRKGIIYTQSELDAMRGQPPRQ